MAGIAVQQHRYREMVELPNDIKKGSHFPFKDKHLVITDNTPVQTCGSNKQRILTHSLNCPSLAILSPCTGYRPGLDFNLLTLKIYKAIFDFLLTSLAQLLFQHSYKAGAHKHTSIAMLYPFCCPFFLM